jgi:uroporphyrinogen-III synthase
MPLIHALEGSGAQVWHYPTLEIQFLRHDQKVQHAITHVTDYAWHIFVSRHAVQAVLPQIVQHWSMLDLGKVHWAAVGPGTAKELAHFIKDNIVYPQQGLGAAALFALLRDKIQTGEGVLVWSGDKPTLPFENAHVITCYRREKHTGNLDKIKKALAADLIDYVLITSGTSLEHLVAQLTVQSLKACTLIVISERLVQLARDLGFDGKIILAQGADEESMINAIKGDVK